MLVNHVGGDFQGFISRDGSREWCYNKFRWRSGCDRNVLMAAHQTETGGDGHRTRSAWSEQTVASNASRGGRPGHRWRLHHRLVVISNGIEIHSGVCVSGQCTGRTDGHAGDVRGVEQHLRPVRGGGSRIE